MSDNRKLQAVDREGSKWPYWVYIPVDTSSWNGPYKHLTNTWPQYLIVESLRKKKINFHFNKRWDKKYGRSFSDTVKTVIWHVYKFKNKGDRLVFLMTTTVEKASDEYR